MTSLPHRRICVYICSVKRVVIIPTYNEKENIQQILHAVISLPSAFHVLVVDNGSPDGTADLVRGVQEEFPQRIFLEERTGKLGLGTAYIHGFRWALREGYDFVCEMDADFSHNPHDLEHLLEACQHGGADIAIGSRYIKGVNVVNWPMSRVLLSYFASYYVRTITGMPIMDPTAGFKCYRREVLETLNLNEIRFVGYAFQIEVKFTAWKFGFNVQEVPIIFTDRTRGESKMSKQIIFEAISGVVQMKISSFFKNYRRQS